MRTLPGERDQPIRPGTPSLNATTINFEEPRRYTLQEIIYKVDLSRFPFPVRLTAVGPNIDVAASVQDRRTGKLIQLNFFFNDTTRFVDSDDTYYYTLEDGIGWIYYCLSKVLEHELDETFIVAGERVFDPHLDDSRKKKQNALRKCPYLYEAR